MKTVNPRAGLILLGVVCGLCFAVYMAVRHLDGPAVTPDPAGTGNDRAAGVNDGAGQPGPGQAMPADDAGTHEERSIADRMAAAVSAGNSRLFRNLAIEYAKKDPKGAAAWAVKNLSPGGDRTFLLRHALLRWTDTAPEKALAWANSLVLKQGRECALRAVFEAWARKDPAAAAGQLRYIEEFDTRSLAAGAIAYYWAREDLSAATGWAWKLPDGPGQVYALATIGRALYFSDRPGASEWARKLPAGMVRDAAVRAIASLLSEDDPEAAAKWLAEQLPGGLRSHAGLVIPIAGWTLRDRDSAMAWAGQMPGERGRQYALAIAAEMIAAKDPAAAAAVALGMALGEERNRAVRRIADYWAREDPVAARAWAEGLTSDQGQQEALAAIDDAGKESADGGSEVPPEEQPGKIGSLDNVPVNILQDPVLGPLLAAPLPDGPMRDGVIHSVAVQWAKDDPVAAAVWAMDQLPDGRVLDTALRVIVWDWTARDAGNAAAWAAGLSDLNRQEHALMSVALALARTNPSGASTVAASIAAGERKNATVSNIAYHWAQVNAPAAREWAEGLSVEDGRDIALEQIEKQE